MDKHTPKYLKEHYDIYTMNSFKDVPGWINDAEFIYPQMVEHAQDGDHFVEIGTFLGQSTSYMCQLIKDSDKDIKFDSIDLFWPIEHSIKNHETTGHPEEFNQYLTDLTREFNLRIEDIIKHPLRVLGIEKYVNLITCDEQYAHGIYEDNSIQFLWIDGDHGKNIVYNDLVNFWPKIKNGGTIGGDDMVYKEVSDDVFKFSKEYNVKVKYENTDGLNYFLITKDEQ